MLHNLRLASMKQPLCILCLMIYFCPQIGSEPDGKDAQGDVINVSKALGNVTICLKGASDIISDGNNGKICIQNINLFY